MDLCKQSDSSWMVALMYGEDTENAMKGSHFFFVMVQPILSSSHKYA